MKPDANGRVNTIFDTPPDLPKPVAMAVTLEPDGGVPAPTGDKYLVGLASEKCGIWNLEVGIRARIPNSEFVIPNY
jgi:hypothetical protein